MSIQPGTPLHQTLTGTGQPMSGTAAPQVAPFFGQQLGPLGPLFQSMLPQILAMGGVQGIPTQFTPQQSFFEQQMAMHFQQQQQQAAVAASDVDRQRFVDAMLGFHRAMGTDFTTQEGQRLMADIQQMGDHFGAVAPFLAQAAPTMFNMLAGGQGSSIVASQAIMRAGQRLRDPARGLTGFRGETAGTLATELTRQIPGMAPELDVGEAGMLFEQMVRRGMVSDAPSAQAQLQDIAGMQLDDGQRRRLAERTGQSVEQVTQRLNEIREIALQVQEGERDIQDALEAIPDFDQFALQAQSQQYARRVASLGGAITAAQEIFGPTTPMPQLIQGIQNLTQGGLHTMTGSQLEQELRLMQSTARITGVGMEGLQGLQVQAASVLDQLGGSRQLAPDVGIQSATFRAALARAGGGAMADPDRVAQADARLRAAASVSPGVNQMNAALRIANMGVLREGSTGARLAEAIRQGETHFTDENGERRHIGQLTQADFMEIMTESGTVGQAEMERLTRTTLDARELNQMFGDQFDTERLGRAMQRDVDVLPVLQRAVRSRFEGEQGDQAAQAVSAIFDMDLRQLAGLSQTEQLGVIRGVVGESLRERMPDATDEQINAMAGSVTNIVARQFSHGQLSRFGFRRALELFNRGVFDTAGAIRAETETEAILRESLGDVGQQGFVQRISDALQQQGADPGADISTMDMFMRAVNVIDTSTEAGRRFRDLLEEYQTGDVANEVKDGQLTERAIERRKEIARELGQLAPDVRMLGERPSGEGPATGRRDSMTPSGAPQTLDTLMSQGPAGGVEAQEQEKKAKQAEKAAKDRKDSEPEDQKQDGRRDTQRIVGELELIGMEKAILAAVNVNDDPDEETV